MKPVKFKLILEGETMASENINFSVVVSSPTPPPSPFTVTDVNGNPLADGAEVTLTAEVVGVDDPGQVMCNLSGGTAPYSASVSSGTVPAGMTATLQTDDNGAQVLLEGTPTTAGTSEFSLTVSDSAGASQTLAARARRPPGK
jgi:hypothetical protein